MFSFSKVCHVRWAKVQCLDRCSTVHPPPPTTQYCTVRNDWGISRQTFIVQYSKVWNDTKSLFMDGF